MKKQAHADLPVLDPKNPPKLVSVGLSVSKGKYAIAGVTVLGTAVSWSGTSRANALAELTLLSQRLT